MNYTPRISIYYSRCLSEDFIDENKEIPPYTMNPVPYLNIKEDLDVSFSSSMFNYLANRTAGSLGGSVDLIAPLKNQ